MIKRGDSTSAYDLEQYLISYNQWSDHLENIPAEQRKMLEDETFIGLGNYPRILHQLLRPRPIHRLGRMGKEKMISLQINEGERKNEDNYQLQKKGFPLLVQ